MTNEELAVRLSAVEKAVTCLALTVSGNSTFDLDGHILYYKERIGRGDLSPELELIYTQVLALLDPLSPKPGDEF
ncbi:hypothetical protein [Erwinia sp. S38]|uniref:hypothetical protein n=1 Tax=Erwinia sp. S38 TaxID=2769338 RepID=UPI00190E0CF3|nr:hypothetical protein [Erwinia sp. S38]MBK0003141.1 hypothetical protein [Erwinia sp. S38]